MRARPSTQAGASELHPETGFTQQREMPDVPSSSFIGSNGKECGQNTENNSIPIDKTLPLLNLSLTKHDRHRSRKHDRYVHAKPEVPSASNARESVDNQTAHLLRKTRAPVETHSPGIDESFLPYLNAKPAVPSPQKINSPLRRMLIRRTWNGALKPQDTRSGHRTLQRRASSSLATFTTTETILVAEIDSDERCASFLRQRAPRETLVLYPDTDDSPQNQIHYKLHVLDRKIQMNKEKLAQVRERIVELGGKPSCMSIASAREEPEQNDYVITQSGHVEDKHDDPKLLNAKQQSTTTRNASTLKESISAVKAALVLQCSFRAFRARRCLADLLTKTYQRVLNPGNSEYFYYNRITRLSQWEAPTLLRRCHCSLDAKPKPAATQVNSTPNNEPTLHKAAKIIQTMFRQRALRVFMQDFKLGNLEKVFDAGFGAWYYFNSRTNRSFWESVHHVRLTASNSAIFHR